MPLKTGLRKVPFRLHPRVFAALGADLVTNDFVAITELVKNSYDAFADRVDVRFRTDETQGDSIEIQDNGLGMDRAAVETVWCVVATPYRAENPVSRKGSKTRRTAGEKGLGRLSMARLGSRLEMLTQAKGKPCLKVEIEWTSLAEASSLDFCLATVEEFDGHSPFKHSGTLLRIYHLQAEWSNERLEELHEHLSRLLSPFSGVEDFAIWLHPKDENVKPAKIESPEFLKNPKYRLSATADASGTLTCKYEFRPIGERKPGRKATIKRDWTAICDAIRESGRNDTRSRIVKNLSKPNCGAFSLEIRAWDIGTGDLDEIVEHFEVKKSLIRSAIRAHKGISVYRDGILVLPKTEGARDWLGLDLRRVSELGTRLSTSQIIGYVAITAEDNPRVKDTSDRERLVDCAEVAAFEELVKASVFILEEQRNPDKLNQKTAERPLKQLFGHLSADSLLEDIKAVAEKDEPASAALPLVDKFNRALKDTREEIERRFVYYSRLATIGTLAQMLVHEVRNKTTIIGSFLAAIAEKGEVSPTLRERLERAQNAVNSLDRLADTFAPLASRSFGRGRRSSVLEDRIAAVLALRERDTHDLKVGVRFPSTGHTQVAVDPGELDAVLLNLIDNAIYWLGQLKKGDRTLDVRTSRTRRGDRIKVSVHDSGPGISDENSERVFWPGVTTKPGGIGMGLTVASEIVDSYDGQMALVQPGELGGASFEFDLPIEVK
jgi:signal transduction histidine kinase